MYYQRKIYALLHALLGQYILDDSGFSYVCGELNVLQPDIQQLENWWSLLNLAERISSSSDRVNLRRRSSNNNPIELRHPISGEPRTITPLEQVQPTEIVQLIERGFERIRNSEKPEEDAKRLLLWCWRFLPEQLASLGSISLETAYLAPTHAILPDCSLHSYSSTVAAVAGALSQSTSQTPYLLLFTFSPVQEFIKSSRKFLDFWSGSYLLHYLSAMLCWEVVQEYGADAVITPSLWGQEIIDALIVKNYPEFQQEFSNSNDPATKFSQLKSLSLSTAGFPNILTVLLPDEASAKEFGKKLENKLKKHWYDMSFKVRNEVKYIVRMLLKDDVAINSQLKKIQQKFPNIDSEKLREELRQYSQKGCWEWNKLWDAQIEKTWETYYVGVPLGSPEEYLEIEGNISQSRQQWINLQNEIAQPRNDLPTDAENNAYSELNVGTWWGSLQARLGNAIQAIKNTRSWQIPVAPGERSTLSGQYSALHPRFLYQQFQDGLGVPSESLRLFWSVMGLAFPGLFNGSEKLNAIELTKRMAWKHGGVADNLGIDFQNFQDDYEALIRFPNLSSIAAAHFASRCPGKMRDFWNDLRREVNNQLRLKYDEFCKYTCRPFQVKAADAVLGDRNGVMFSSKWLADDMNLEDASEINTLRSIIDKVSQKYFGDGSPADWWVLVLGDGDGMGGYVTGRKLEKYQEYIVSDLVNWEGIETWRNSLEETTKRMGPATHVGLNRALLDFSNRLVPYITEERFCGRVIYSGGDDVMAALPLANLFGFLRSLRAAWCGGRDPENKFSSNGGYWYWNAQETRPADIPDRPLFTMGKKATMSLGVVIAHKSVPLPTVLENLWTAEKDRAKKLLGGKSADGETIFPAKDGLCFRVIYGSGNTLEAFMKGHLLDLWWSFMQTAEGEEKLDLSPLLYRLAEEIPRHAEVTPDYQMFRKVARVVIRSRDTKISVETENAFLDWLDAWENWAWIAQQQNPKALGAKPEDIAMVLRFSAFWVSRRIQEREWEVRS